ncbi:hypothetical protein UlMin_032927 [Ulmus minor]
MVLIYVDDMIVTGSDSLSLQKFIKRLHNLLALKDMGSLRHFLGIEVRRDEGGMYLTQTRYIEELLKKTEMVNTKPCLTPVVIGKPLTAEDRELLQNPTPYRSIIGALLYLTNTRPDIAFIVNRLSHFMQSPTISHWQGAKRVLHYLKGTRNMGLHIKFFQRLDLQSFTDAEYACCLDNRRSTAGYCVYLGDTLVSWPSKKQTVVS